MDYELAKRLKDAGFPQGGDSDWYYLDGYKEPDIRNMEDFYSEELYIPTLEELVEACGDKFSYLHQSERGWHAHSHADGTMNVYGQEGGDGKTPIEAVANLYLALYNKDNETTKHKNE